MDDPTGRADRRSEAVARAPPAQGAAAIGRCSRSSHNWKGGLTSQVDLVSRVVLLADPLGRPTLGQPGVHRHLVLIDLQHVEEEGEHLFQLRAVLDQRGPVVKVAEQLDVDGAVGQEAREEAAGRPDLGGQLGHLCIAHHAASARTGRTRLVRRAA